LEGSSFSTFAYVAGSPSSSTDPLGLKVPGAGGALHGWKPGGLPAGPPKVRREVKEYLCKLIRKCGGNATCVRNDANTARNGKKTPDGPADPNTWNDPVLREAENWAVAAAPVADIYHYTTHSEIGIIVYQLVKPIGEVLGRDSTDISADALGAGLAGNYWYKRPPEDLLKWCNECEK
jgi:hypothetical protein